ncbi:MAG: plastocyanin [Burkholderiales bacterium]|nr:plastocyanin [Burkholderiales bacterium]
MKKHLACALLGLLGSAAALAAQLQITVLNAEGKPAADVAVLVQPTAAWKPQPLPEPVVIAQQNIRFVPYLTVVPVGATVRFLNRDRYDHHVRSQAGGPLGNVAPAQQFEFRMAGAKGDKLSSADLKLDTAGQIALGCHLHGSMRGHLLVSATPWFGVTDDNGQVSVANVPDGQVELKAAHVLRLRRFGQLDRIDLPRQ